MLPVDDGPGNQVLSVICGKQTQPLLLGWLQLCFGAVSVKDYFVSLFQFLAAGISQGLDFKTGLRPWMFALHGAKDWSKAITSQEISEPHRGALSYHFVGLKSRGPLSSQKAGGKPKFGSCCLFQQMIKWKLSLTNPWMCDCPSPSHVQQGRAPGDGARCRSRWLGGSGTRAAAVGAVPSTWVSNQLLSPGLSIWNLSPALNSL